MRATATLVQYIQEHQNDVYEEIRKLGIEEGRNLAQNDAYNEGYATGYSDTIQDKYTFEQFRLEGRKDSYEKGLKEGEERGRAAEREKGETKRERVEIDEGVQTEPTTCEMTDSGTQTTSITTTADAVMQTASNDEPPRLLNDVGTSIERSNTCETAIQTEDNPPAPTASVTSPPFPANAATSPLTTPAQPPSTSTTLLTTATNTAVPASKQPPPSREWWHSLPDQSTAHQPSPQPPFAP
jgi:hypothetical protein